MPLNEESTVTASAGIDEAIGRMEDLYRAVTGSAPPQGDAPYSPIPIEKDPSKYVEQQIDRLLSMLGPSRVPALAWTPPIAVWENDKEFLVCVDLPGVGRRDVEVTVNDNVLTVSGNRPAPAPADHRLRGTEHALGNFVRRVLLPSGFRRADATAHVSAQLRDGVLEVRLGKEGASAEKPKSIPVN